MSGIPIGNIGNPGFSSTAMTGTITCLTLVTNYNNNKSYCTTGENCNSKCIVSQNDKNSYCLTNVRFSNIDSSQFIGYYQPCQGNLRRF